MLKSSIERKKKYLNNHIRKQICEKLRMLRDKSKEDKNISSNSQYFIRKTFNELELIPCEFGDGSDHKWYKDTLVEKIEQLEIKVKNLSTQERIIVIQKIIHLSISRCLYTDYIFGINDLVDGYCGCLIKYKNNDEKRILDEYIKTNISTKRRTFK
jgi:hypothetical protein